LSSRCKLREDDAILQMVLLAWPYIWQKSLAATMQGKYLISSSLLCFAHHSNASSYSLIPSTSLLVESCSIAPSWRHSYCLQVSSTGGFSLLVLLSTQWRKFTCPLVHRTLISARVVRRQQRVKRPVASAVNMRGPMYSMISRRQSCHGQSQYWDWMARFT
jgi:hypothetical protein